MTKMLDAYRRAQSNMAQCYGTCHQPQSGDLLNCLPAGFPSPDAPLPLGKCRISSRRRHLTVFPPDSTRLCSSVRSLQPKQVPTLALRSAARSRARQSVTSVPMGRALSAERGLLHNTGWHTGIPHVIHVTTHGSSHGNCDTPRNRRGLCGVSAYGILAMGKESADARPLQDRSWDGIEG